MLQITRRHHLLANGFFSTLAESNAVSPSWRREAQDRRLLSEISTILLQRHNWASLLYTLNLSSKLTPCLFRQVLSRIQNNPQMSLDFFSWAESNLGFEPDLKTHLELTRILLGSGNARKAKPMLDSMVRANPPAVVVDSLLQACKSPAMMEVSVLSSIVHCYVKRGSNSDSLAVYGRIVSGGFVPEIGCCNALLDSLGSACEFRFAWCLCGSMIRNGVALNSNTWSIVARILYRSGKSRNVVKMLDSGIYSPVIFDIAVECHSKCGNFETAINCLNDMCGRKFEPSFNTYSSVLNGACEYGDFEVAKLIMKMMIEKRLIPQLLVSLDYDNTIKKLCDCGHSHGGEMLFKKAADGNLRLKGTTYGCMLRAFAKEGRVKEALELYRMISEKRITVHKSSLQALGDTLCNESPSVGVNTTMTELIISGVRPCELKLSVYIMSLCRNCRWEETESLINLILEKGLLLSDLSCCRLLVMKYCSSGDVESALSLHDKLEAAELVLDAKAYNVLLRKLFEAMKVEEAVRVFDYMRRKNVISTASFIVMISGLSSDKDMRRAMRVHDQMVEMGMKPSPRTYRNIISVFA